MKILGIDTTTNIASVALISENKFLGEFNINYKKTHSETILPMISKLLDTININLEEIDYIACSNGPGSFTGIRVGAAVAKALAHGTNKLMIPVPTLDALAYNNLEEKKIIIPIIDAKKEQVYTCIYKNTNKYQEKISKYLNISIYEIIKIANSFKEEVIFLGDGVDANIDILNLYNFKISKFYHNYNKAINVCLKSLNLLSKNKCVSYNNFELIYLKKSQAERDINEK